MKSKETRTRGWEETSISLKIENTGGNYNGELGMGETSISLKIETIGGNHNGELRKDTGKPGEPMRGTENNTKKMGGETTRALDHKMQKGTFHEGHG